MRRGETAKLIRQVGTGGSLKPSDRAVLLTLLERSHNETGEIEAKYAPHSRDELARWAGLSTRQVQRAMGHLEAHGWLKVERGNGRGKGSRYCLVPRVPDMVCGCRKGDTVTPIGEAVKGDTMSAKGRHGVRERETSETESSQVDTAFQARTARTEEEGVCSVFADGTCSGAATFLSCQLCPKSPTYWRTAS